MKRIVLILIFFIAFGTTCMQHFFLQRKSSPIMLAYIGEESIRNVHKKSRQMDGDLHVFGRRARIRTTKYSMSTKRNPFETFRRSTYSVLIIFWKMRNLPIFMHNDRVLAYHFKNDTIAIAWPKEVDAPSDHVADPLLWYRRMGGHVEHLYI